MHWMPRSSIAATLIAMRTDWGVSCKGSARTAAGSQPRLTAKRLARVGWRQPIANSPTGSTRRLARSRTCCKRMAGRPEMGQVNATIAGRQYRLACEDGQEEHLLGLAKDLETRIIDLRRKFGEIGDTRLTVMAALMLADEGSEMAGRVRTLEAEIAGLDDERVAASDRARAASDAVVGAFHSAAERIESITRKLNQTAGAPTVAVG